MKLRTFIRKIVPTTPRLLVRILLRNTSDFFTGTRFAFSTTQASQTTLRPSFTIQQEITPAGNFEAKINNLQLAIEKINGRVIMPNQVFSFWRLVGNPTKRNGYAKSRSVTNGQQIAEYGGGLCQLSGLLYHLSLQGNVSIVERHNHSIDLYTDTTRFTPLGADAAVVYGYKDVRVLNNTDMALAFHFEIVGAILKGTLNSSQPITPRLIHFERFHTAAGKKVIGYDDKRNVVNRSNYFGL